jgi:uncharacterized membrane protein (UPF0127 family)
MAPHRLRNARTGELIATAVELADSPWKRMRGLLGRSGLDEGAGMRFEPTSSLHMMFMRFAIDVVYVDRDERIVKLVPHFKPWRFSMARGARSAYELTVGTLEAHDVAVGDQLVLEPNGAEVPA